MREENVSLSPRLRFDLARSRTMRSPLTESALECSMKCGIFALRLPLFASLVILLASLQVGAGVALADEQAEPERQPVAQTTSLRVTQVQVEAQSESEEAETQDELAADSENANGQDAQDAQDAQQAGAPPEAEPEKAPERRLGTVPPLSSEQERDVDRLLKRVRAPCCWTEALITHRSPEADRLRAEIVTRVQDGEHVDSIEADLIDRYGGRILTVPQEGAAQNTVFALMIGAFIAALLLIFYIASRRLRSTRSKKAAASPELDEELEKRIEAELERLEEE